MANITTYLANKLLDHALGTAAYTHPATVYVALFTANPTIAGTQTSEPTGASYTRIAVDFDAAVAGALDNTAQVTFAKLVGTAESWGTVAYWGIMDASTAGNMLFFGTLAPLMLITEGMQYIVPEGTLDMSIPLT